MPETASNPILHLLFATEQSIGLLGASVDIFIIYNILKQHAIISIAKTKSHTKKITKIRSCLNF